jgi:hypothetical protein
MAVTHVWMRHPAHGGVAQFPEKSVAAWTAIGWEPCDPPAELDPREDPRYVDVPAQPDPKPAPAKPAAKTPAPAGDPKKEKADV